MPDDIQFSSPFSPPPAQPAAPAVATGPFADLDMPAAPPPAPDPNDPATQLRELVKLLDTAAPTYLEPAAIRGIANHYDHPIYGALVRPLTPLCLQALLLIVQSQQARIAELEAKLAGAVAS